VEHAKFFEQEALNHKRSANRWLFFTILFVVLAGVAASVNFVKAQELAAHAFSSKTADAKPEGFVGLEIQLTVAKLIILSILLSAGIWAGRVYKAHRHNFVINRHRRNALSTFQTFATGTSDPQIKNAVLLQATTCIFGPQNTGYINQEKESDAYPQILEIVRGVGK
jgi:heme/copper-type cytochrome/quinol oxidase subunit 2